MAKIPPHATRVFKGILHDVYQWEQKLFDGTTTTFECLKRPNTTIVLPIVDGEILYARQEQPGRPPFLSCFGGRGEEGEEPLITAKRELKEETGLASDNWQLIRQYSIPGKIEWNIFFYAAYDCYKDGEPLLDGGEKIEILETDIHTFFSKVVKDPHFAEHDIRREVFSAFNPEAAKKLEEDLLKK